MKLLFSCCKTVRHRRWAMNSEQQTTKHHAHTERGTHSWQCKCASARVLQMISSQRPPPPPTQFDKVERVRLTHFHLHKWVRNDLILAVFDSLFVLRIYSLLTSWYRLGSVVMTHDDETERPSHFPCPPIHSVTVGELTNLLRENLSVEILNKTNSSKDS